jgi:hypothetical protein
MIDILYPCSRSTQTGTLSAQGIGTDRDSAIQQAISSALTLLEFLPPRAPRCPAQCPIRRMGSFAVRNFTVNAEGKLDIRERYYVEGVLEWGRERTCSKLHWPGKPGLPEKPWRGRAERAGTRKKKRRSV